MRIRHLLIAPAFGIEFGDTASFTHSAPEISEDGETTPQLEKNDSSAALQGDLPEYEVESILDCGAKKGVAEYLVKWKGCPSEENMWVSPENLNSYFSTL